MHTNTVTIPTNPVTEIKTKKQYKKRPPRICSVEGCNNIHHAKSFCEFHYCEKIRSVKLKALRRLNRDNEKQCRIRNNKKQCRIRKPRIFNFFVFDDKICKIIVKNAQGEIKATALIDSEDYDRIKEYNWYVYSGRYTEIKSHIKGSNKKIYLSRIIMQPPEEFIVDHINHDTLDNRKQNLRVCNQQQNQWNTKSYNRKNKKHGYKGVRHNNFRNCWCARIFFNNKEIYIGSFPTEEAAALAYNEAAIKYFGEFACLNEIKKETSND